MNMHATNITPSASASALSERAMLAGLHVRQWSARKVDRRATAKVNSDAGAHADAGRYNKALISKDALADIAAVVNKARSEHYARTLPWADDGARILSAAGYLAYSNTMRELRGQFVAAVEAFTANYDAFRADAQSRLGTLYNPGDYPPGDEIRGRFSLGVNILPMPDAADFRVDLADGQADAVRADIERRMGEASAAAMRDVYDRIAEKVGAMVEKLNEYRPADRNQKAQGIFRDSLVQNVRDLVGLLPSLNLTGDQHMNDIADRMARDLCRFDPDTLRTSESARSETANAASAILADVSEYLA